MHLSVSALPDAITVNLKILTPESEWRGKWGFLEVWRSVLGEGGPYEPLFSSGYVGARVPAGGGEPFLPVGGSLLEGLDQLPLEVMFGATKLRYVHPSAAPITMVDFAEALQDALPLRAWVDDGYALVLESVNVGPESFMEVLPSDAASYLGLPVVRPSSVGVGRGPRVHLTPGQTHVDFTDRVGSKEYYYQFRYSDGQFASDFSLPVSGRDWAQGVDPSQMAVGYVRLARMGKPALGQRIIVRAVEAARHEDWTTIIDEVSAVTDENGYAALDLQRGVLLDVSLPGTGLVRRVKLPEMGDSFDLMDPVIGVEDDSTRIHRVERVYGDRRN